MVSLSNHRWLERASFDKLRMSRHQWAALLCNRPGCWASRVSKFRGNVRVNVQRKCHSVKPGWYQMTAWQQQPPGLSRWRAFGIHVFLYGGSVDSQFPLDCPKRHPLAPGFLNRLPSLLLKERWFPRRGGCGPAGCGRVVSDHTADRSRPPPLSPAVREPPSSVLLGRWHRRSGEGHLRRLRGRS